MPFVRGKGSTWGPLQHVLMGGLHFQTRRGGVVDVCARLLLFPQPKYVGEPMGGAA